MATDPKPIDPAVRSGARAATGRPEAMAGAPGAVVYGGYLQDNEKNVALVGNERWRTYSDILVNTSIVGASIRYFLNLVAKAGWMFEPAEADKDRKYAELAEKVLTNDPATSWIRIVRRAAMYRFYGFSIQEWAAKRCEDGVLTLRDVAPRPQSTITKWDLDTEGAVLGVVQCSPQTGEALYIERPYMLYMVDDTLCDSPEGLGIMRHLVSPAARLARYEQLEGIGFQTDLRGIPIGRAPLTYLSDLVKEEKITEAERARIEAPLRAFVQGHVRTSDLALLLDSMTYQSEDEAATPSQIPQWNVELLKSGATSFEENAAAIERLNREIARLLGTEQLMLGEGSAGSHALSRDKTNSFFLLTDATLREIAEQVNDDLLGGLWQLNGWPEEMKPRPVPESVRHTDIEEITAALKDLATAGAPLDVRDPAVDTVRTMLGLDGRPQELIDELEEASLMDEPKGNGNKDNDDKNTPDKDGVDA